MACGCSIVLLTQFPKTEALETVINLSVLMAWSSVYWCQEKAPHVLQETLEQDGDFYKTDVSSKVEAT